MKKQNTFSTGMAAVLWISLCDSNHDMISGISGAVYYLLDCDYTKEEKHILKACIEYLVALTRDTKFEGKSIIKFHVLQPNQNPNFNQEKFKRGNINFVALVVRGEKSPQLQAFPRQPARQRDSNGVGNRLWFPGFFRREVPSARSLLQIRPAFFHARCQRPLLGLPVPSPFACRILQISGDWRNTSIP